MLGDNSKIHIDEIATKLAGKPVKLSEAVIENYSFGSVTGYVRFGNGLQICWRESIVVPYENDRFCQATWTYPVTFSGLTTVIPTRTNYWGAWNQTVAVPSADADNTRAIIRFWRQPEHTFGKSDSIEARLIAVGRWK